MENKKLTHWKKLHNLDYLGSYSLEPGQDMVVTIKEAKKEQVTGSGGNKEECLVAYFTDAEKPMILNRTNCKTIEKIYTPYIEDWVGKKIQLYVEKVRAFGDTVDALRIRPEQPDKKKPELTPDSPKWNDAVDHLRSGKSIEAITKHYDISDENQTKLMEAAL